MIDQDNPNWAPLRAVMPLADCDAWMWMGRSVHDGTVIELYKHRQTRGYLNLSADGRAWLFRRVNLGCDPWCDVDHDHVPDPPAVAEQVSMETAREWAWI